MIKIYGVILLLFIGSSSVLYAAENLPNIIPAKGGYYERIISCQDGPPSLKNTPPSWIKCHFGKSISNWYYVYFNVKNNATLIERSATITVEWPNNQMPSGYGTCTFKLIQEAGYSIVISKDNKFWMDGGTTMYLSI